MGQRPEWLAFAPMQPSSRWQFAVRSLLQYNEMIASPPPYPGFASSSSWRDFLHPLSLFALYSGNRQPRTFKTATICGLPRRPTCATIVAFPLLTQLPAVSAQSIVKSTVHTPLPRFERYRCIQVSRITSSCSLLNRSAPGRGLISTSA